MRRRELLAGVGLGALGAALGCTRQPGPAGEAGPGRTYDWKMVTTWPPHFPGAGTGAERLARTIEQASNGRIRVRVYGAGELVPAFEIFDAVSAGTAQLGHGASYYWKGKSEAAQFFTAVPFGMTAQEMNGWLFHGGGIELWRELYAPFNLLPMPAGNTGVQMGGWFNRAINSLADLKGLKMRIPGLGGEIMRRAGGTPVNMPGAEIYTAMQTGSIDATEWIGPYNDLAFGLHEVARYYYYPGWHEPCATLECIINRKAYEDLPEDLQALLLAACQAANDDMLAEYTARNHSALRTLVEEHGVELRPFPQEVLARLQAITREVLDEIAARDATFRRVYAAYGEHQRQAQAWSAVAEQAYFGTRPSRPR